MSQISADPFTNPGSQHATQVEPDTFAFGHTVIAAFQTGRYTDGGSSDIGYSVSRDGGRSWPNRGFLPFLTPQSNPPGPYARASDPAVAYDRAHRTWLISTLVLGTTTGGNALTTSRSTDGGRTWSRPSVIPAGPGQDFDKNWIVCDNTRSSPFFGHCYTTWDDFGRVDILLSATSVDGGLTWSEPAPTPDTARGIGGQPVVQPDGTVIVPTANVAQSELLSYRSTDGGASWSSSIVVSDIQSHVVAGALRTSPLPSAEIDGSGTVYVAWQDCRFRAGCTANDIVLARSTDGLTWSRPSRVPISPVSGTADHFIPGLGVDPASHGSTARLALSYSFYREAACATASCRLEVGVITSSDAGATWSAPHTLTRTPMALSWLAATTQGPMVGDYMSTSFAGSTAVAVFAVAHPRTSLLHEAMFSAVVAVPSHRGELSATTRGAAINRRSLGQLRDRPLSRTARR